LFFRYGIPNKIDSIINGKTNFTLHRVASRLPMIQIVKCIELVATPYKSDGYSHTSSFVSHINLMP